MDPDQPPLSPPSPPPGGYAAGDLLGLMDPVRNSDSDDSSSDMSDPSWQSDTPSLSSLEGYPYVPLGLRRRGRGINDAARDSATAGSSKGHQGNKKIQQLLDSDDSDIESPQYLQEMCSSFTKKLKEKNNVVNIYKKVLFNTQLQLMKKESAHQRQLRKILVESKIKDIQLRNANVEKEQRLLGADNGVNIQFYGEDGRDALLILPEEIWIMILDQVTDVKDLRSCAKVCTLFSTTLEATKSQWLFEKAFPLVFNYLRRKDVLKCRQTCKKWCAGVDTFLETYYTVKPTVDTSKNFGLDQMEASLQLPTVAPKSFHFEYNFSIPPPLPEDLASSDNESNPSSVSSQNSLTRNHDKCREKMKLHTGNPFIGRSVTLEENSADFDNVQAEAGNRLFRSGVIEFIKDFGSHVWHLTLCCNMHIQSPTNFYEACLYSLANCKNLKNLCLAADLNWRACGQQNELVEKLNQLPSPPHCDYLESLQVDMDNVKIFLIQDKLIEKYSNQLKRVEVRLWNVEIYQNFSWSALQELQVNHGKADALIENLKNIKAPNLAKLTLRLDGRGPYLQALLELTNHFSKLNSLEINFDSRFAGISEEELLTLPPGITSSASLTTLELTSNLTDIISYNFLMFFPFLQRLLIRHGHWTTYNLLDATAPYFTHLQRAGFKNIRKGEVVKIAKYIVWGDVDSDLKVMYKSNVWGILPFLQVLEICNARYVPERRRTFTRAGYEHYQKTV